MPIDWLQAMGTTKGAIGVAVSSSPFGPWERVGTEPVLRCSDDREAFDSLRVDDACVIAREGRYWMYYKGLQWGRTPAETKMGVAFAHQPMGPWIKFEGNPVLDSGHEVCVWPHGAGVGCLVSYAGPQANTLQYSADGIRFTKVTDCVPPKAAGPYREDNFGEGMGPGITWGICTGYDDPQRPYLLRFDCDLSL